MVRSNFYQREVLFGHERLLDPSMPKCMEGILRGIKTHLGKSEAEPFLEFAVKDRSELAVVVSRLKDRGVSANIFNSDHILQAEDGANRAQLRAVVVLGQRYLLDPIHGLDSLRLVHFKLETLS